MFRPISGIPRRGLGSAKHSTPRVALRNDLLTTLDLPPLGARTMTSTVFTFVLSDLVTGVGRLAMICPDAQYAAIASRGGDRIERRFVTPAHCRELTYTRLPGTAGSL